MAQVAYDVLHKLAPVVAEQFVFQNASTTQNELYGDLNMDHLNWLERKWASYYIWMGNALLATGVMSFVMHEVSYIRLRIGIKLTMQIVYFGRAIPWLIIDAIPYFHQWKLQPVGPDHNRVRATH